MIEIVSTSDVKVYEMKHNDETFLTLNLINSSITNKFYIITNFISNLSQTIGEEFDIWLKDFLIKYKENDEERFSILEENIPYIKLYVDQYIQNVNIDYDQFVDESKAKKSSILFNAIEIKAIIQLSNYLKLYSLISNEENFKLPKRLHKNIYNIIARELISSDVILKVFNVIKTKTFRYNITDRAMWDYIKMIQSKDVDAYVIEIFNFIMNQILVLCEEDKNPIIYFVSVIDESVKWVLRSVYKGTIIYEDSISTEDVHGPNIDNLKSYSYNDTLGMLKTIAYDHIFNLLEKNSAVKFETDLQDEAITKLQTRLSEIQYVSPVCEFLVYPIFSKLTNIPYQYFETLSPEHSAVLSLYLNIILKRVFSKNEYNDLFSLLEYYPTSEPAIATTYKIKQYQLYIKIQNEIQNFYGFNTKTIPHDILNYFIGRISRINLFKIIDGQRLMGIPMSKIESDAIVFYTKLWSNSFTNEFKIMKKIIDSNF